MEAFWILIALAVFVIAFILPIIALVTAIEARRNNEQLAKRVYELELELSVVKRKLAVKPATTAAEATQAAAAPVAAPPAAPSSTPKTEPVAPAKETITRNAATSRDISPS